MRSQKIQVAHPGDIGRHAAIAAKPDRRLRAAQAGELAAIEYSHV
jgi:hypothetical protein